MVCIHCRGETKVINSRLKKRANNVWRRRHCLACDAVFTTLETADLVSSWGVRDLKGKISPYNRDKLYLSIYESCRHRNKAVTEASHLTDTITERLQANIESGVISSSIIKKTALVTLNRFDRAAGTSYQAFHP